MTGKKRSLERIAAAISLLVTILAPSLLRHTALKGYTTGFLIAALGAESLWLIVAVARNRRRKPPA